MKERVARWFATKLAAGFVLVMMLLTAAAILSAQKLAESAEERDLHARQYLDEVVYAERLRSAEDGRASAGRGYLITRNPDFLARLEAAEIAFDNALGELRSRVRSSEGAKLLEDVTRAAADYKRAQGRILGEKAKNDAELRRQFEDEVVPKRRDFKQAIAVFVAHKESQLQKGYEEMRAKAKAAISASLILFAGTVLASALVAWRIGRHLATIYRREMEAVGAAKRALAARDELLGVVAHDLRSPLMAITLKAAMLRKSDQNSKPVRDQAESIENVAMMMESMIKSLLDAASIESGRFAVSRAPNAVEDAVIEAMEILRSLAASKPVRLKTDIKEPGLWVLADRERIIQVLTNLVGNAIKFTENGAVEIIVERECEQVKFSITDTGPGIAHNDLLHVFDRFWKAEAGGKKGTGLGLYIAKGIVEAHGGQIWAESKLDQGTTFHFTIPFIDKPSSDSVAQAPQGERRGANTGG